MEENKKVNVEGKELEIRQYLELLDMAFADGVLTEQEKEFVMKKAQDLGIGAAVAQNLLESKMKEMGVEIDKTSKVSSNSVISAPNYKREFDRIKNQGFRPIGEVVFLSGRRTKYDNYDRRSHVNIETERIKGESCMFIDTISPSNEVEVIDALDFLSSFLPPSSIEVLMPERGNFGSPEYKYDRDFVLRAVPKLKTIIKESEDEFYEDVDVMKKVKVVKERLGTLVNSLETELEKSNEQLTNSDKYFEEEVIAFNNTLKPFRRRRYIRWGIFGITLAAAWLLAGFGWGWSVVVNVLTIAGWIIWYEEIGDRFTSEYKDLKYKKPDVAKKADKERELKNTISCCKKEIRIFRL